MRVLPLLVLLAARSALATFALPHVGYLVEASDAPVSGARSFAFALHAESSGGTATWSSGACVLTVRSGRYDVRLGDGCGGAISAADLGVSKFLEVAVEGVPLTRVHVAAVPSTLDAAMLGGLDPTSLDARYGRSFAADGAGPQSGHLDVTGVVKAGAFAGDGSGVTDVDAALHEGLHQAARDGRFAQVFATDPRVSGSAQPGAIVLAGNARALAFAGAGDTLTAVDAAKLSNTTFGTLDSRTVQVISQDPDVVATTAQAGHVDVAGTLKAAKFTGALDTFGVLSLSSPIDLPGASTCSPSTAGRVRTGLNGVEVCDAGQWWLVPTARVRAWFGFDESVGTMALDATSSARSVALSGVTWTASGGRRNGYVTFAGNASSYAVVPPAILHGLKDFTVSFWLRKSGAVGREASRFLFSFALSGNDNAWLVYGPSGTGGVWQHFVMRRRAGTLRIYRDGTLADDYLYTATPPANPIDTTGSGLVLAQDQDTVGGTFEATQAWAGDFDEFKVLDYGITDAELAANTL